MSIESESVGDDTERDADRQAEAMKAQLRKDVASWSNTRSEASPERIAEPSAPVNQPASPRPVPRAKKSGATPAADKPEGSRSKPFSMSYGGETTGDYIRYMIDRGAR
jgi:hypothetical protein